MIQYLSQDGLRVPLDIVVPDDCKSIVSSLDNRDLDKSAPYTKGLLNDEADSFFDPNIEAVERVKQKVFTEGLKIYADKIRAFNWSYYGIDKFHVSEMVVRKYHQNSEYGHTLVINFEHSKLVTPFQIKFEYPLTLTLDRIQFIKLFLFLLLPIIDVLIVK